MKILKLQHKTVLVEQAGKNTVEQSLMVIILSLAMVSASCSTRVIAQPISASCHCTPVQPVIMPSTIHAILVQNMRILVHVQMLR